ncbi:Ger(x)C family spore germination protein [Cytobacillus sp. FJAT-53684]|uniref:Ger(X)C family spore germination protein n=1 Tax=Cytobacillus mangrovibacter TaxID=3299024 RepID=A0ABW6JVR4_9BACI
MKKWRQKYILILMVCITLLAGCTRTRIIDKISIVHVFGFDQAENGQLIGTALFPEYTKSKSSDEIQLLDEQAQNANLIVSKMTTQTSTPVEIAKIRVLLFGNGYAESGVQDMVERFIITPQLGTNIQIAVSTNSANETLETFKKGKTLTLMDQIQHNMLSGSLPEINLHVFLNHFYGEGMDAYVPMITIDEKKMIKVDGIGVFKGDQFKLHLNREQTVLFSYIKDRKTEAIFKIVLDAKDPGELITVKGFRSKSKWDWDKNKGELNLQLKLDMTLTQYPNRYQLEKDKDVLKIKQLIEEKLVKDINDLVATLKENEVDPIGIGNIVRSKDDSWEEKSFYEQYPTLPINVNVKLQIIHSGLEG